MTDTSPAQQREQFLSTYFKHMPAGHWGYIWSLEKDVRSGEKKKRSHSRWYRNVADMLPYIEQHLTSTDIYFGTSLSDYERGAQARVKNDDASAILGLRIDLDIASPDVPTAHKAEWLPRDFDEAMRVLDALPEPTIVVHSGNGIHAHWLFDAAFVLDTPERRADAQTLMDDWIAIIRDRADDIGREVAASVGREPEAFHIDGTHDVSRVLRVPGTFNHKSEPPKLATLVLCNDEQRYSIDYLTQVTIDYEVTFGRVTPISAARSSKATRAAITEALHANFRVSATAEPPFTKWREAMKVRMFTQTWNMKRKLHDSTPSAWDEALAVQCLLRDFDEQETIDTLVAFRREHGHDLKMDNAQYYVRSVAAAKQYIADYAATHTTPESDDDEHARDEQSVAGVSLRDTSRATVRKKLRAPIDRIIKYLAEEPTYRILLDDEREVVLDDVSHLINQVKLRNKLAAAANIVIPLFDKDEWQIIASHLLKFLDEEAMPEATRKGRIARVLDEYLNDRKPVEFSEAAAQERQPFVADGVTHIFSGDLKRHINLFDPTNPVNDREMCLLLRMFGAEQITHYYYAEGNAGRKRRTSCSVWRLPSRAQHDDDEVHASSA